MNILDAAYRIGQQMKTLPIGREWVELYKQLSQTISPEAWNTFLKTPSGFKHYYSFAHAMDVIEENSTRDDLPEFLKDQLQELIASQPLKRLSELSVTLGDNLLSMINNSLTPSPIPRDFGELRASPKLSRTIQDLHRAFQRSGILKSMLRYIDPETKELPSIYNTFNQEKSLIPHQLSPEIRKLVRNLGTNQEQQKLLTVMYISDLILEITGQMVFESHLGGVVDIPSDSIIRSVVKDVDGICPVYLRLDESMMSQLNRAGQFIIVWLGGATQIVILTRSKMQFGQKTPGGFKMTVNGYIYPKSDVNLLD